ncbi:type 2 periplasmic-binding domain-containing protein [Bowmanella dokdonensis]|uniref:Solute-binding protein family 3/N-terminal domain-containing protein n=1 Tax=Bowmanella dokdonensis TaxID=751969 RepID=A0A939IQL0_9ALTE|nr:hypothetical protein [Bowmanella dokdonensis]MBN7827055.1 hypothetical protein [Bowmanella dokdonensis]
MTYLKSLPGLLLLLICTAATAEEFSVGVEDLNYYPHYTIEGGEYKGFARAVLDAFAEKHGHVFIYQARPVTRLFHDYLNKEQFDFKYPDNKNWQADMKAGKNLFYSEPVVAFIDGVMVLPQNKGTGESQLKVLGTIRGFSPWTYMDQIKAGKIRMQETSEFVQLLKMAVNGRVDGSYLNIDVARYQLEAELNQASALVFDDSLPYAKDNYHLSTIKHPQIIEQFNAFLTDEHELIEKMKAEYGLMVE